MFSEDKKDNNDFRRIEDILSHFEKAKKFTEEILQENERLRLKSFHLEKEKLENKSKLPSDNLANENKELKEKIRALEQRFMEMENENREFAEKYLQIQTTNDNLMNLYVSSYQLHCTLDPEEVVKVIKEIIINLIGAAYFQIYMLDNKKQKLTLVAGEAPEGPISSRNVNEIDPVMESVLRDGLPYFREKSQSNSLYIACTPLRVKNDIVGMIAINKLLPQKKENLTAMDYELLSLLADHAATALLSSNLYSRTERKLKTVESLMELLKLSK